MPDKDIEKCDEAEEPQRVTIFDDCSASSAITSNGAGTSCDDIIPIFTVRKTYFSTGAVRDREDIFTKILPKPGKKINHEEKGKESAKAEKEPLYAIVDHYSGPSGDYAIQICSIDTTYTRLQRVIDIEDLSILPALVQALRASFDVLTAPSARGKRRTLVIDVKSPGFAPPGSVSRYFVQADTTLDFNKWRFDMSCKM